MGFIRKGNLDGGAFSLSQFLSLSRYIHIYIGCEEFFLCRLNGLCGISIVVDGGGRSKRGLDGIFLVYIPKGSHREGFLCSCVCVCRQ